MIEVTLPTFHADQAAAYRLRNPDGSYPLRKAIRCGRRWGKALALDTPIPTPSGWTTMGELEVGDDVFDERGQICRVIAATEVQFGRPCKRVIFSDGAEIVADDDHRWLTWDKRARKNASRNLLNPSAGTKRPIVNEAPAVRTTAEIAATLMSGGERNHSIPCTGALILDVAPLPIPPYVLGAWLGDGNTANCGFTCHPNDAQIVAEIQAEGQPVVKDKTDPNAWRLTEGCGKLDGFTTRAKALGVLSNKHIPARYLRASFEQRLALLQGLMDTDGWANAQGRCEFCSTLKVLADDTLELALSLGIRATMFEGRSRLNGVDYGPSYRIKFTTSKPVFRLKRKAARVKQRTAKFRVEHRFIHDIVPVESVPVRCIAVDSPSHLYLASRSFIPTHNTEYGKTKACDGAIKRKTIGWFAPDYKRLAEAYNEILAILRPVRLASSKTEGLIRTTTGGRIDFWTLDDENAGRSRRYHEVIIDEGAFTKTPNMLGIWEKAIEPTLLDFGGAATVLSNTNGNDPENFFYAICNDPKWGFIEYHAPSWANPLIPIRQLNESETAYAARRDEIFAKLRREKHPLVFAQEYAAEFVDWAGASFFSLDKLLAGGAPLPWPTTCDSVFAIIDSATKTGKANDGTAVTWFALDAANPFHPLLILDWDIAQIEGDLLINWLPGVLNRSEDLALRCGARSGSLGALIEDKDSGQILLQAGTRRGLPVQGIPGDLTAIGKDERAMKASGHVYPGRVKFTTPAYEKVMEFKGTARNHLLSQITGFRIGDKDAGKRADDLLDTFTYGVCVALGDADGL